MGGKNLKSVNHYKSLGAVLNTEFSDDKGIQRQLRYQYCAANKLPASFSRCSNAVKNAHFCSFCTPICIKIWWNFRKSCMQRLRVTYNFGCRALCNLPWKASIISVAIRFNITFLPLRTSYEKISTWFLKDAEILTTYACMLWRSQIVSMFVLVPIL